MSSQTFETFLAKLYTDPVLLARFLADPESETKHAELSEDEVIALRCIDRIGLQMAAASYARKREQHRQPRQGLSLFNIF